METEFYFSTTSFEGGVKVSAQEIRRFLETVGKRKQQQILVSEYIEGYLSDIALGKRVSNKGTKLRRGTVLCLSQALRKFVEFQQVNRLKLGFEDISLNIYRDYTAFLMEQNYSINTIGKHIKKLRQLLACAEEDGHSVNQAFKGKSFKVHNVPTDAIYLTKENLNAINSLNLRDFPKEYALARDIFMIGVYTAQRVSDYNNLHPDNFVLTPQGEIQALRITQVKTGKRVVIPCCSALQNIFRHYSLKNLPHLHEQKINNLMKEISRMAGLTEPVEVCTTKGGVAVRSSVPKWQLIQTHTARRTGATLMYLSGMDVYDICKITGHSSVQTLERYIKAGELETLKKLSTEYEFFR